MEEAPDQDCCGDEKKSKRLVAPEEAALGCSARLFGGLLFIRLDASFNHEHLYGNMIGPDDSAATPQYRGAAGSCIAG